MGRLTIVWLIGSGVGVITAPITNASTKAYFLKLAMRFALTMPILLRKYMTIGSSKVRPTQNRNVETKSRYRSVDRNGLKMSVWKPPRKAIAKGSMNE